MPELGGSLTDLEILNLDDGPSPEVSPTSPETSSESIPVGEPSQAAETTPAAATPTPEVADDYAWAKPLLQNPQYATKFKAAQERLETYQKTFGSVARAREFTRQIQALGGIDKVKEIKVHADQLDSVDGIYFGHDPEAKRQFLTNLHGQDPQAFLNVMRNSLAVIKADPERFSYIVGPLVAERLTADGVWDWLEFIYEKVAANGDSEFAGLLNQFAGVLARQGIGPSGEINPDFRGALVNAVADGLDPKILSEIQEQLGQAHANNEQLVSAVFAQVQGELLREAKTNGNLRYALRNILRGGSSRKTGERAVQLITTKLARVIPGVVRRQVKEFLPPQEPTPVKADTTKAKKERPERALAQGEANRMSDGAILDSSRLGQRRETWRPESVFDDKVAP